MDVRHGMQETDRLAKLDFERHNAEVKELWPAFDAGVAPRVPIAFGTNSRYFMGDPTANPEGLTFQPYIENPDVMFDAQVKYQRWSRFNLLQDQELGCPEKWSVGVDFQNFYEAAWFGCKVKYFEGQVPDTRPDFAKNPESLLEKGIPGAFDGIMGQAIEYYEHLKERGAREGYLGRPVEAGCFTGSGTDGPVTVACNLFGPVFVFSTLLEDPDRMHRLFEFITEATIQRMEAWRERFGIPVPQDGFGMADDSIALISTSMYRDEILPYHRRIYDTFGTQKGRGIHLCGDSTRHFVLLRDELNIRSFDTGFPVDFGDLRRKLGPDIRIQGGPHVELLISATPVQVREEVRRILTSGILQGGRFQLREGNNLAPKTPLANTEAMYRAGVEFGKLG